MNEKMDLAEHVPAPITYEAPAITQTESVSARLHHANSDFL